VLLGVALAALNTGNNLLYLVLSMMLSFLVLSGLLSEASLRGIRVDRRLPRELFAESPNRVALRITRAPGRGAAYALEIEDRLATSAGDEPSGRVFVLRVAAGDSLERSYVWTPPRRGGVAWRGLRVSTRFPFGLFAKSLVLEDADARLVYPRVERTALEPMGVDRAGDREILGARSPEGDVLTGVRDRAPGDSSGRILWRRSLRAGRMLVGERDDDTAAEIEIFLEGSGAATGATLERRISRAASEVVTHLEAGFRVGLRTSETRFSPVAGARQRRRLLSFLAEFSTAECEPAARGEAA